jgi:hypothetical protein
MFFEATAISGFPLCCRMARALAHGGWKSNRCQQEMNGIRR